MKTGTGQIQRQSDGWQISTKFETLDVVSINQFCENKLEALSDATVYLSLERTEYDSSLFRCLVSGHKAQGMFDDDAYCLVRVA